MRTKRYLSILLCLVAVPMAAQSLDSLGTGSSRTYSGEALEKYPTIDMTNSFTGVIPGLYQTEDSGRTGTRFNLANATLRMRGFSNPAYIVDGIIVKESTELQLNPDEIESVTLVTDIADKLKYGPEVAQGAIYIKTLTGIRKGREIKASFEKGVDVVDRFPQWVGGYEYALLNNQSRTDAGYPIRYSEDALKILAIGDPYDLSYPNVDYRSLMFKDLRNMTKASVVLRGGGEAVRYSANLGYAGQDDIYNVGNQSNFNRFNAKMNIDADINPRLNINFSFIGSYSIRKSPLSSYTVHDNSTEFPSVISMVRGTPATEYPLNIGLDEATGRRIYPISVSYADNPYASLAETGGYDESQRTGITKATINYDLSGLIKGLKSETQISYNIFYLLRMGQASDYIGYTYDTQKRSGTPSTTHQGLSDSDKSEYKTLYYQGLQFYEKLRYDKQWTNDAINAAFTYYRSNVAYNVNSSFHNQQYFVLSASYNHKRRFLVDAILNCAGTSSLQPGHRYGFFPALGLGWVMSEEPFMKGADWLDYLKFRAQAGITGNETYGDQFYWQSKYTKTAQMTFGPYNVGQWFGSTTYNTKGTVASRLANANLDWEKLYEFSAGVDAKFFKSLTFAATYYRTLRAGIVTDMSAVMPGFYGATPFMANNNSYLYSGLELALDFSRKSGDFSYSIGANCLIPRTKYVKYAESVAYDNLKHEGRSLSMLLGYDYLGKFASQEEIASSPVQTFDSSVQVGDLKYADLTGDKVVDENDRKVIGDSSPKFLYAVNLHFAYKNLDLTVVGTGKAFYDVILNNVYYWNGWGDGNYSAFVSEGLKSGAYPRLSYNKSENNFRASQFWMVDGSYFKIQNVEIGYNFNMRPDLKWLRQIRVFARGANLLTISGIKDCDPEALSSGVTDYPLFRTFTGGVRFSF